jgi:hypothetical protein
MPQPPLTAVYLDFESPECDRVWAWLSATPARAAVEVRPFWSQTTLAGSRQGPWERSAPTSGLELLALAEFARDCGREVHLRLIDAAFAALHGESADATGLELWLAIGGRAGLDMAAFTADVERWRAEVGLYYAEARDDLGVTGVPTLVFAERTALYLDLAAPVTDPDAATALLAQVAALAAGPVREARRTSG